MNKPRIFLGSSGKQAKLLQAITRGLEDVADVEPWTTTFNPGRGTLERLVELSQEVDFAAFVFAQDDWTATEGVPARPGLAARQRGVRGGAVRRRTRDTAHVHPARERLEAADRPARADLRALRRGYRPAEVRAINQKLRKAIESEGRRARRGAVVAALADERTEEEPSAVSLLRIARDHDGGLDGQRPVVAAGRHAVGALLERGREGAASRRASSTSGRASVPGTRSAAARGHRRDQGRDRRPGGRLLDDTVGTRPRAERPNLGRLPTGRPLRPRAAGRRERGGAGRSHRAAPPGVEVGREHILSATPRKVRGTV